MRPTPTTLTVVFCDTLRTRVAIVNENEHIPYGRRSVRVDLTPEQRALLQLRCVGMEQGEPVYEELATCWLETNEADYATRQRVQD